MVIALDCKSCNGGSTPPLTFLLKNSRGMSNKDSTVFTEYYLVEAIVYALSIVKSVKQKRSFSKLLKEKWLSGLKRWLAKSKYSRCIAGSNPAFSDNFNLK
jgi:hypothetical protein